MKQEIKCKVQVSHKTIAQGKLEFDTAVQAPHLVMIHDDPDVPGPVALGPDGVRAARQRGFSRAVSVQVVAFESKLYNQFFT